MKLHPRFQHVQQAEAELRTVLLDFQAEHDLTDVEMLRALLAGTERLSKWLLREERHPDTYDGPKGDEECTGACRHGLPEAPRTCTDCGRAAKHLEPVFGDVDGVNQITGWLGPGCYRKHLDRLREAAIGPGCVLIEMPIGGDR